MNPEKRISLQVPEHFIDDYPRFIEFLEKYYEWLHRDSGLSEKEIINIRDNAETWTEDNETVDDALLRINNERNTGSLVENFIDDNLLRREFDYIETSDGFLIETTDDKVIQSQRLNKNIVKDLLTRFDFPYTENNIINNYDFLLTSNSNFFLTELGENFVLPPENQEQQTRIRTLDYIRLIKIIKKVYQVRGTLKSIELFFDLFFGEPIDVIYPKTSIFIIDDVSSVIDDSDSVIRDDYVYNEFSYVIKTPKDPSTYETLFNSIYLKYFHPSGFRVFIQQRDDTLQDLMNL